MDTPEYSISPTVVAVVDVGWSQTSVSFYRVSNGLIFPIISKIDPEVNYKALNDSLVKFCIKDFSRRCKLNCAESTRSVTRLSLQCERGIKVLSTSQEATIVVDSLFEGVDYTGRISRSRFEDLCSGMALSLRSLLRNTLETENISPESVTHVVVTGILRVNTNVFGAY